MMQFWGPALGIGVLLVAAALWIRPWIDDHGQADE
jgi:hypothetical protein